MVEHGASNSSQAASEANVRKPNQLIGKKFKAWFYRLPLSITISDLYLQGWVVTGEKHGANSRFKNLQVSITVLNITL